MNLGREYIGMINLPDGKVDITDPGYDNDVWCRMNDVEVYPGNYKCYAYTKDGYTLIVQIVCDEEAVKDTVEAKVRKNRSWRRIGIIGVDAGLAGFFSHKKNYNYYEWEDFCDDIDDTASGQIVDNGFFSQSGYGDGMYGVHAIRNNGKIAALEIRF